MHTANACRSPPDSRPALTRQFVLQNGEDLQKLVPLNPEFAVSVPEAEMQVLIDGETWKNVTSLHQIPEAHLHPNMFGDLRDVEILEEHTAALGPQ